MDWDKVQLDKQVQLHGHTHYSNTGGFKDSVIKPGDAMKYVASLGQKAIAFTEHEQMGGHIKYLDACEELKSKGELPPDFKVILGNEIYLVDEQEMKSQMENKERVHFYHFIMNALDEVGHRQLRELSTRAWMRMFSWRGIERKPTYYEDIEEIIGSNPGHVIVSTACFLEGHAVKTKEGLKRIEEFSGGEMVWTNKGWKSVNFPTSRNYEGSIITITSQGGSLPITCTSNHKFLVLKKEECYDYQKYGYNEELLKKHYLFEKGSKQHWKRALTNSPVEWVEANELRKGDYLLTPVDMEVKDIDIIDMNYIKEKYPRHIHDNKSKELKKYEFKVDNNFLRMIGLYMAEGSMSKIENGYTVQWTLHKDEHDLQVFLIEYLMEYGLNAKVIKKGESNGVSVEVNSKHFRMIMEELVGKKTSHTKSTPNFIKILPQNKQWHYIRGLFEGDGYFRKDYRENGHICHREITYATCSKDLAMEVVDILNRMSINPTLSLSKAHYDKKGVYHSDAYYVCTSGKIADKISDFVWGGGEPPLLTYKDFMTKDFFVEREGVKYLRHKITKLENEERNTRVYCLNVEEAHNFVVEGVLAHNCLGGFLSQHILNEEYDKVEGFIEWCQDVFGKDHFFLEMQPHKRHYDEEGNEIISEQRIVNEWIYERNLPTIITTDSHYLKEEHRALHKAFLTSDQDDDKASVREVDAFYETTYLQSSEEIHSHLDHYLPTEFIDECIDNAWWISQQVKGYNLKKTQIVAEIPLPPEEEWFVNDEMLDLFYDNADEFEAILDAWESDNPYNAYLISLCMKGASDEFLIPSKDEWWDTFKRVNLEMEEVLGISNTGGYNMSAYFITMNKFINIIWNEAEAILGDSRGSALGFATNYLLDIVQSNPLKQPVELPHWRSM